VSPPESPPTSPDTGSLVRPRVSIKDVRRRIGTATCSEIPQLVDHIIWLRALSMISQEDVGTLADAVRMRAGKAISEIQPRHFEHATAVLIALLNNAEQHPQFTARDEVKRAFEKRLRNLAEHPKSTFDMIAAVHLKAKELVSRELIVSHPMDMTMARMVRWVEYASLSSLNDNVLVLGTLSQSTQCVKDQLSARLQEIALTLKPTSTKQVVLFSNVLCTLFCGGADFYGDKIEEALTDVLLEGLSTWSLSSLLIHFEAAGTMNRICCTFSRFPGHIRFSVGTVLANRLRYILEAMNVPSDAHRIQDDYSAWQRVVKAAHKAGALRFDDAARRIVMSSIADSNSRCQSSSKLADAATIVDALQYALIHLFNAVSA